MTTVLKPYSSYAPSPVPWLDDVPAEWSAIRLDRLFRYRSEEPLEGDARVTGYLDGRVTLRSNVAGQKIKGVVHETGWQRIHVGDFAISGMNAHLGGMGVSDSEGKCSPIYLVLEPRPGTNAHFVSLAVRHAAHFGAIKALVQTIRFNSADMKRADLKSIYVPLPPPEEQAQIVRFIRHLDQRVNRLIKTKRRLIELLNEQKQAIIHRAVTRGLDPTVPLKPSGIDWLGDIPAHWTVARIKHLVRMRSGDGITAERIEETGEFPVFGGNGLRGFTDAFTHVGDYILIGRQGALCGNIQYASGKFWASEHAVVCTPIKPFDQKWLGELLKVMNLNQYSISAAQPGLAVERIKSLQLPLPPIAEQEQISLWFLEQTADLELVLAKARSEIDLIREYRTRLVADVVTGQLDVRHLDLPEVEESLIEAIDTESDSEEDEPDEGVE